MLEGVTCGADGLVGLLRVLDLRRVDAWLCGEVALAEELGDLLAGRGDGLRGQGHRVGSHVGDEALFVELLCHGHGALRGEAELAAGLLLHRGGAERLVGTARVGLRLHRADPQRGGAERLGERLGRGLVEHERVAAGQLTRGVEVTALGDAGALHLGEARRKVAGVAVGAGVERDVQVPVGGGDEGDALALLVDDEPGRHGLDAPGGQPGHDLLPQHRGDLVAVEPVEDAAGLLRVDKVDVELAGVPDGLLDRGLGDFVEHHPLDRDLGLELLHQVPRDGLAFAVTIGGEQELVDLLELGLQVLDGGLLVGGDHVDRLEVVGDVDAGAGPLLALVLGWHLGRRCRQVTDVSTAGLDDVVATEVAGDLGRLGRRLHDHETLRSHQLVPFRGERLTTQ